MTSPFSPEELAYLEAHKNDSRVSQIRWVYSVPIAAATLSTVMRLWAKRYGRNGITLDDYLILLATTCLIGQCASGLGFGPPHGMGKHVNVVSAYDQMMVRKGDYVFSHFYDIALVSVKLGILAFYYRVFVHPVFRRVVLATAAFVLAWGIGITVTLFLACRPLAAYWDRNVTGKCLVMLTFTYFTNISNLITDIWIFLMPMPMIWHLQLQTKKKMILSLIFCIGLATCVVSSIRLTIILGRGRPDFTWYYVPLGAYSVFEPLGGILCTNLPIIWHMFRKRQATLINASAFKSHSNSNSTPTIGSRRSRFAIALGITTRDRTQNGSGNGTGLGGDSVAGGVGDWQRLESMESQKPDPTIWTTVERVDTGGLDEGPSEAPLKPGMKKTVWNVRK
ncbi:uncharacterized protein K460DRAFT_95336 [Cucurbitaria berberidis CBS 394.84]|uniref:Rhodopsin domain-containing protein n=1 Tax=Cucurbitaria berberidis CBS 394.84 TaxID=1168544 RepID=A0A9P4GG45_9PLEO|nr:uncharacterized protein K460DRAFT_95336 [Cucurbitaria berberidis CBS 394.84]KAF1844631.1 hypothetical protein K460DRAFT_95336 [Cucurbitaria berberidis CBS 394.84]